MYNYRSIGNDPFIGNVSFDTHSLLDATAGAVRVGWVMQSPWHNEAITQVAYRQGTTTGTPGANSYKVTIVTVDGDGNPTTTDVGSTETTFQPVAANNNTIVWITLANSYSPARGTFFAVVIENNTNTSANGITVALRSAETVGIGMVLPYASSYAGGSWTKTSSGFRVPIFGIGTATKRFGFPVVGIAARTVGTSGHRATAAFTIPTTVCQTYKVPGFWGQVRPGAASGSHKLGIWDTSGTLLQGGTAFDGDSLRASGVQNNFIGMFDGTLATLNAGTKYYIGVEHDGSTVGMGVTTLSDANDRLAVSDFNNDIAYASWNGSTWTETTTDVPRLKVFLDELTFASGGGGGASAYGFFG